MVRIVCEANGSLEQIEIQNECFLLLVLLSGALSFFIKETKITAEGPCFICLDEKENPKFQTPHKAKYFCIYFHPTFLNVNMTLDLVRSRAYEDIARIHDMFLLKPFLEAYYIVPILNIQTAKVQETCEGLKRELEEQPDWYWSCRSRSYFMELLICLERMDEVYMTNISEGEAAFTANSVKLQAAIDYIESHYSEKITLNNIMESSGLDHTTLTRLCSQETGRTAMEYLKFFRVRVAKKHLAFTDIPLKEVAARCGFKTTAHFSRIFKQETGETPADFRRSALEKRKRELQ